MLPSALVQWAELVPDAIHWSAQMMLSRPTTVIPLPAEPSTLSLALIASVLIGAYAMAGRSLRSRSSEIMSAGKPASRASKKRAA